MERWPNTLLALILRLDAFNFIVRVIVGETAHDIHLATCGDILVDVSVNCFGTNWRNQLGLNWQSVSG